MQDRAELLKDLHEMLSKDKMAKETEVFVASPSQEVELDPGPFLQQILGLKGRYENAAIYYHNDMDGIASAIIARDLLKVIGFNISAKGMVPITHIDREHIVKDPTILALYVDIQPLYNAENVFCVDHHRVLHHELEPGHSFIKPPGEWDEHPTVTASLVAYLFHVNEHGYLPLSDFMTQKVWAKNLFQRWLLLLAMASDNLWMLSPRSDNKLLNEWIEEFYLTEKDVILVSMGISLLLGREDKGLGSLKKLLEDRPLGAFDEFFKEVIKDISQETDTLFIFSRELDYEVRRIIEQKRIELGKAVSETHEEILRANNTIENYRRAMPKELRSQSDRTKLLEMLKTVANKDRLKWKQIEFYGNEIEKLETNIASNTTKLDLLQKKYEKILEENLPGICLFIPKQGSDQVKGILASLLYYFGWNNIIIEETEYYAMWGARGFEKEVLEDHLATFDFNRELLQSYTNIEEFARDLPNVYRKSLADAQGLVLEKKYSGQIGGRGKIFGGNVKGKVPSLFSTLDSNLIVSKIAELIKHSELGLALKGLTEGDSMVSTSSALRSKFKHTNWITIQVLSGSRTGNILTGDISVILAWILGQDAEIKINISNKMLI